MIVRIAAWPCAHRQKASVARQKKEGGGRRRKRGGAGGAGEGSGDAEGFCRTASPMTAVCVVEVSRRSVATHPFSCASSRGSRASP